MLKRTAYVVSVGLLVAMLQVLATPAGHGAPGECLTWEDRFVNGVIQTVCTAWGTSGGGNGSDQPANNTGGSSGGQEECYWQGRKQDCDGGDGWSWTNGSECYIGDRVDNRPPPAGKNDGDGGWYEHWCPTNGFPELDVRWLDSADQPEQRINPIVLARRAMAQLALKPVDIGIAPKPGPNSRGLVGLPVWMWAQSPGPSTYGPLSDSASDGPVTVTLEAKVEKVEWDMGDGSPTVICSEGTPYDESYGAEESPTCGHRYEKTSAGQPNNQYTVTATSFWVVEWSGGGMSGTLRTEMSDSVQIRVGEMQVLEQN